MVGIYKITNLFTGETYIGQSRNIEQRFKKHQSSTDSHIGRIIDEVGKENFSYEVVELCNEDQLDEREKYYIDYYKSNTLGFGYNIVAGGQDNVGESNANVKLTEYDVYNIREAYKNHERKNDVYERYKNKVTRSYFSNVWGGISWKHVHYDVYTEENVNYYRFETSLGENSSKAKFTDNEVLELRKRYVTENARQIYESVKDKCSFQTLQCILWGRYYSHIPVYSKSEKKWIDKE